MVLSKSNGKTLFNDHFSCFYFCYLARDPPLQLGKPPLGGCDQFFLGGGRVDLPHPDFVNASVSVSSSMPLLGTSPSGCTCWWTGPESWMGCTVCARHHGIGGSAVSQRRSGTETSASAWEFLRAEENATFNITLTRYE